MKINKRLIYKTLFTLIGIVILSIGGFMAYLMIPSGFQSRQAEGPKVLTELLKMAEESQPFNPDPYISSTYRPGDPLYEPVLAIQRERWDIAKKLLQPLVEQGNADAIYWLAHISGGSIYAGKEIARLFRKSAELGNPYAALRLDVSSEDCSLYLRGYCDPKWGKLGRKLLQERAEKGDKKAEYYLLQYDEDSSEEVHKELERLVTENAKNHYYQPLEKLLTDYFDNWHMPFLDRDKPLGKRKKLLLSELIKIAADNNYIPAINMVFQYKKLFKSDYIHINLIKILNLGGDLIHCQNYYINKSRKNREEIIDGASCAIAKDYIRGEDNEMLIFNFSLKKNKLDKLTSEELQKAEIRAQKIIKEMTPMIYIDEMNPRP